MGREQRMKQGAAQERQVEVVEEKALTTTATSDVDYGAMEALLAKGDLSKLDDEGRSKYVLMLCKSLKLNPLMKPFDFIVLNGRLTCYTNRNATDQLRQVHRVDLTITERGLLEILPGQASDVYVVKAHAALPGGRTDESTGAVSIRGKSGEDLANAVMKAETKAKRRVTLSILGLSFLDESELDTVKYEKPSSPEPRRIQPSAPAAYVVPSSSSQSSEVPPGVGGASPPEASAASGPAAEIVRPLPPPVPPAGRGPQPGFAAPAGGPLPPPRPATPAPLVTSSYPQAAPTAPSAPTAPPPLARPSPRRG